MVRWKSINKGRKGWHNKTLADPIDHGLAAQGVRTRSKTPITKLLIKKGIGLTPKKHKQLREMDEYIKLQQEKMEERKERREKIKGEREEILKRKEEERLKRRKETQEEREEGRLKEERRRNILKQLEREKKEREIKKLIKKKKWKKIVWWAPKKGYKKIRKGAEEVSDPSSKFHKTTS